MSNIAEGTSLTVGSHKVNVVRFLSEGGFSKIYEVTMDPPHDDTEVGCLKQVIVPDKSGLNALRKEVDVMKTLHLAKHIVRYYDSNAERLADGQYQVLVLMELCPNKSLLEYMNARIRTKLTEKEILKIMVDITLGLYEMHKIKLIHRDVKIENVLIDAKHVFKLCDFGSVSVPIRPPKDQREFQLLSHDILYQTTPQYRSPEMVDLYRAQPIDEKSDIWALGCFLYKLCYYTTPFEANGDIAILHASFQFLPQPEFSGDLKNLIIIMLQENPLYRPNVVQILMLLCQMTGKKIEDYDVEDFYHAGAYNFQALHEMQQHKQEELRKQQQLYYEQQKQQQEYEMRKIKAQAAAQKDVPKRSTSLRSQSQQASVENMLPSVLNVPSPSIKAHGSSASLASPQQLATAPVAPVPRETDYSSAQSSPHFASQIPKSGSVPPQVAQNLTSPLAVASSPATQKSKLHQVTLVKDDSQANLAQLNHKYDSSNNPFPILKETPYPVDQKPIEDVTDGSTADSDIDLEEISKLANAEERYPSLDALNDEADKASASASVHRKSLEFSVNTLLGQSASASRKALQDPELKRPSEFESTKAWEKPQSHIDKDAEKLVDDIFATKTGPSETAGTSVPSTSSKEPSLYASQQLVPQGSPDYFYQQQAPALVTSELNSNTSHARVDAKSAEVSKQAQVAPMPVPVPEVQEPKKMDGLSNGLKRPSPSHGSVSMDASAQLSQKPDFSTSYSLGTVPVKEGRKDANPWGGSLAQGRSPRPIPVNNASDDLNMGKLSLNEPVAPSPQQQHANLAPAAPHAASGSQPVGSRGPSIELDRNLIELEVGLSSGESSEATPPPLPPHPARKQREEVSLVDLDGKEEAKKPPIKKSLSQAPSQPFEMREEVIDFASDDENQQLEMSRLSIRNSLRKSRKLSDYHRRSDSTNSELKRRSFFGGD